MVLGNPDTCKYLTARTNSYKYDSDPNEPCTKKTLKNHSHSESFRLSQYMQES